MQLRQIAHARTGDKGDTSQIALIAYRPEDYGFLLETVTSERVKSHFDRIVHGDVHRHELPGISALIFVMEKALGSGVTRSLAIDPHGKCLGMTLLAMELEEGQSSTPSMARGEG